LNALVENNGSSNEKAEESSSELERAYATPLESGHTEFTDAVDDEREFPAAEKIQELTLDEMFAEYDTPAPPKRLWGKARDATGFLSKLRSLPSQMAQKASEKRRSVQQSTLERMKALKDGTVKWTKSTAGKGFTLIVGETGDRKYVRAICFVGATSCAVFGPAATGQALLGSVKLTWSVATGSYTATSYTANAVYQVYAYSNWIVGASGYAAGWTQRSRVRKYANPISTAFSRVQNFVRSNPVKTVCASVPVLGAGATCLAYAPSGALLGTVAAVGSTVGTAVSLATPFLPVLTGLSLGAGLDRWLGKQVLNVGKNIVKRVAQKGVDQVKKASNGVRKGWQGVRNVARFAAATKTKPVGDGWVAVTSAGNPTPPSRSEKRLRELVDEVHKAKDDGLKKQVKELQRQYNEASYGKGKSLQDVIRGFVSL
jgi:hypothetical protein